ncbi:ASCH domain-containing protein [Ohtaekwangia kribbensis]|uniref:ASCH domain-containing protein n=1 Tax=Ohtaekwangia kribbensis TaxID=688913 RepID=A0ABW3JUU1_9BACT
MFKVITVKQPWAQLIVMGLKEWETRSKGTPHRGELYIQSSKAFDEEDWELCVTNPFFKEAIPDPNRLVCGEIIGKVDVTAVQKTEVIRQLLRMNDTYKGKRELAFGDFRDGRFGYQCSNAVEFSNHIKVRGQLGIWNSALPLDKILVPKVKEVVYV